MRKYVQLIIVAAFTLSFGHHLNGQDVDFTLRYNENALQYEVYALPDFDDPFFFVGGGNQISLVLPESVNNTPIQIQTVNGGLWIDNSQIYSPLADPAHDFHGIASNGSGVTFTNGEELLMFTFSLPGNSCYSGIRLFINNIDPQSTDPGMGGGDFNNYFANVFDFVDYYNNNYDNTGTVCLSPPEISPTTLIVFQDSFETLCLPIVDENPGDTFTAFLCAPPPSNGTPEIALVDDILCLTYTPSPGYIGLDEVCLTVCDQTDLCASYTVPVIVIPLNCTGPDDADNDTVCDLIDNCLGIPNPGQEDCNNDGIGDACEPDSDGDGIPDVCDFCDGDDGSGDSDGDGVCDNIDNCVFTPNPGQEDCDSDGVGDACEADSDGDGIPDGCDFCDGDDGSGDSDGDGVCDNIDNCVLTPNPGQEDCDSDGVGDACEADSDGDGVPDGCDFCDGDDNSGDSDSDGVCDNIDNCVLTPNPGQEDCDNDGEGDACEADSDGDGIPDGCDFCDGDNTSGDTDGDGVCDNIDNCVFTPNPAQADCDNDGEGDACEVDSDGDTVPDDCDICEGNDAFGDDDNDGICNEAPNCDNDYDLNIWNDGIECVQPFTDVQLFTNVIGDNINLDYFTFSWSGENNFSSSSQNPILPNIENDDSGTYTVTITNTLSGCQDILSTVVDVTIIPVEPQITTSAQIICDGGDFVLSIPEYSGTEVHYEWTGPNGSTSSGAYPDNEEILITDFNISDSGEYQVYVIVDQCSSIPSEPVLIEVQSELQEPQITGTGEFCNGAIITLQTDEIADEYYWTGPGGFSSNQPNPSITNTAGPQHEGTYSLVLTTNGCVSPAGTIEVSIVESPSVPILDLSTDICMGDDIVLSVVGADAASYQWIAPSASPNSSFGILGDPDNVVWTTEASTTITMANNPAFYEAGLWQVQALTANGCVSDPSVPLALNINALPEAAIPSSEGDVCEDWPLFLHASLVPGATYRWYDGDPYNAPAGVLVATEKDPVLYNLTPGVHQFYVQTEINGCVSTDYFFTEVTVKEKPIITSIANTGPYCLGESIQLETSEIPGATYYWYGPNSYASNSQNPIITGASSEMAGVYLFFVEVDGCTSLTATTEVFVNETVDVPIAINNGPLCEGADLLLSVTNPDPSATYEWFDSTGNISVGFGENLLIEEVDAAMSGTYYVIATINSCSSNPSQNTNTGEDAFSQVIIESPESDVAYVGDPLYACGSSITLNALPPTSGTGQWELLNGGPNTTILQPGEANSLVIDLQQGINELVWTVSSTHCGVTSSDTLVIEWSAPPIAVDDAFEVEYNQTLNDIDVLNNDSPNTAAFDLNILSDVENGNLVLLDDNNMTYWPEQGFIGTEIFEYSICQEYCPDICDEGIVTIAVATGFDCEVASIMTPNRDGYNDTFIITCVLDFPGSSLSIFNRWGDEIYFNSDYKNDWEGTWKGENLPAGTYYYTLILNDEKKTKMSGYIYVER